MLLISLQLRYCQSKEQDEISLCWTVTGIDVPSWCCLQREVKKKKRKKKLRQPKGGENCRGKDASNIHIPCLVVHDDKTHFCIIRFLLKLCEATTVKDASNMMTAAGLVLNPLGLCPKS